MEDKDFAILHSQYHGGLLRPRASVATVLT